MNTHTRNSIEGLESRIAPATFTVTTIADDGAGSLRQAMSSANSTAGADQIQFDLDFGVTILLASALPKIIEKVTIDTNALEVRIDGTNAGAGADGFSLTGESHSGTVIRGFWLLNFSGRGLAIANEGSNTISGCLVTNNGSHGIEILSKKNIVSGCAIYSNVGDGIRVTGDNNTGNTLRGNQMLPDGLGSNGGFPIDLGGDGPTQNDANDADPGPNNLQNAPLLLAAGIGSNLGYARGELRSTPSQDFAIDFFFGDQFLGDLTVTTDAAGVARFTLPIPLGSVGLGGPIQAIATSTEGDTSEYSRPVFFGPAADDLMNIRGNVATFIDVDGDKVTIKTTRGTLDAGDFTIIPEGRGARLYNFVIDPSCRGAVVSINAGKSKTGDGFVNVGVVETVTNLQSLTIDGDVFVLFLGAPGTPRSLDVLTVQSIGLNQALGFLVCDVILRGSVRDFIVKGSIEDANISTSGSILGNLKIGGSFTSSTLSVLNKIGSLQIGGNFIDGVIESDSIGSVFIKGSIGGDSNEISAGGRFIPIDRFGPAIGSFKAGSNVANFLLTTGSDGCIGSISVGGNWTASSVAAGVDAGGDGRFGTADDLVIPGGDPTVIAKIANITIKGTVSGNGTGAFGFVAEHIGSARIGANLLALTGGKDVFPVDAASSVFVREI